MVGCDLMRRVADGDSFHCMSVRNLLTEAFLGQEVDRRFVSIAEALRLASDAALTDLAALECALQAPMRSALAGQRDLLELAATLAEAVLVAQAFTENNQRASEAAAALFLRKNGIEYTSEVAAAVLHRYAHAV